MSSSSADGRMNGRETWLAAISVPGERTAFPNPYFNHAKLTCSSLSVTKQHMARAGSMKQRRNPLLACDQRFRAVPEACQCPGALCHLRPI